MQLKPHSTLQDGKYEIVRVLGQGGFGITYLAEQTLVDRKVCIKEFFIKEYCVRDEDTSRVSLGAPVNAEMLQNYMAKFIKEAKTIARLNHPNIVKIFDVFKENDTAYIVMEYIDGQSLGEHVNKDGALPEDKALEYIRQVGAALTYAHGRHVMHLDVKPSNIMLDEHENRLVLIDFGMSKQYTEGGEQTSSTPIGLSQGYAPLEQYKSGGVKEFYPATDIYSLGATLYKLITGDTPPSASEVNEDGLPEMNGVSAPIVKAIEAAMQPRRKDRPQSVDVFLALLYAPAPVAAKNAEETVIIPPKPTKPSTPARKSAPTAEKKGIPSRVYAAISAVVIAVGVFLLWHKGNGSNTNTIAQAPQDTTVRVQTPEKTEPVVVEVKEIKLNKKELELREGETATLKVTISPSDATDKTVTWKSSNQSVAKVTSNGKVTAVNAGSAAIIASAGGKEDYCNVTVTTKQSVVQNQEPRSSESGGTGSINGHQWVDLGLSVKWATCNVGASSESDYGSYFAWGEVTPKSEYSWSNLKYCLDSSGGRFSKYVASSSYGTVDNKTKLDLSDDAARYNWGGSWRMPTSDELKELLDKCQWQWTTRGGHDGYLVTGPSGRSIFLPAAGSWRGSSSNVVGSIGSCWSSSLYTSDSIYAYYLGFSSGGKGWNYHGIACIRSDGHSVRPVTE